MATITRNKKYYSHLAFFYIMLLTEFLSPFLLFKIDNESLATTIEGYGAFIPDSGKTIIRDISIVLSLGTALSNCIASADYDGTLEALDDAKRFRFSGLFAVLAVLFSTAVVAGAAATPIGIIAENNESQDLGLSTVLALSVYGAIGQTILYLAFTGNRFVKFYELLVSLYQQPATYQNFINKFVCSPKKMGGALSSNFFRFVLYAAIPTAVGGNQAWSFAFSFSGLIGNLITITGPSISKTIEPEEDKEPTDTANTSLIQTIISNFLACFPVVGFSLYAFIGAPALFVPNASPFTKSVVGTLGFLLSLPAVVERFPRWKIGTQGGLSYLATLPCFRCCTHQDAGIEHAPLLPGAVPSRT